MDVVILPTEDIADDMISDSVRQSTNQELESVHNGDDSEDDLQLFLLQVQRKVSSRKASKNPEIPERLARLTRLGNTRQTSYKL